MPELDSPSQPVTFSVLIGLVSTEDGCRILETLESLRKQAGAHTYEVLIGDCRNDEISRTIERNYPEVKLIPCPPRASLPELRTAALDRAKGQYIIVTEDHCVPTGNWLDRMAQAFCTAPPGTAAVGGCVENGVHDTALDWARFFCEYSYFLAPVTERCQHRSARHERGVRPLQFSASRPFASYRRILGDDGAFGIIEGG